MIQPTTSAIAEWIRSVALQVNPILNGYSFPQLATAPNNVSAGYTYYDTALNKVRTWDGTAWNNHW